MIDNIMNYVAKDLVVLVVVLYIIGLVLKGLEIIKDKYIPIILLPIGIVLSMFEVGFNINGVIQGILTTGAAVYTNQLLKQVKKDE